MRKSWMLGAPLLAIGLPACREAPRPPAVAAGAAAVAVKVIPVSEEKAPASYEAVGTVRARTAALISSKVMGYVREVHVRPGDRVSPGQRLVTLDDRDLDAAYRQAEAARQEARDAGSEVEHATASAQAQLDLAQTTFRRMQGLYEKKSISDQEFDEVSARLKAARAAQEMAVAKRAQAASRLLQAEQAVRAAEVMRGYARITAPLAAVVTERSVEPGNLAAPGAPLLTLEQTGALQLEVAAAESLLAGVRLGQDVPVRFDFLDRVVPAKVAEIVPAVDAASRTFVVKLAVPAVPNLRSGVFGRAQFPRGFRTALMIPADAISEQGQVQSVLVAEDGIARNRMVTSGKAAGSRVEILSGLRAGDLLIYPRPAALADGAKVEVRR